MSRRLAYLVIMLKPMEETRLQRLLEELRALAPAPDGAEPTGEAQDGTQDHEPGGKL